MALYYPEPHIDLDAFSTVFVEHPAPVPRKIVSRSRRWLKYSLLLVASLTIWTFAFCEYAPQTTSRLWLRLTANKAVVTGILYDADNPRAIVCGHIVCEGDTVSDYRIARINRDSVDLLRNGRLITEPVKNTPGIAVPELN